MYFACIYLKIHKHVKEGESDGLGFKTQGPFIYNKAGQVGILEEARNHARSSPTNH